MLPEKWKHGKFGVFLPIIMPIFMGLDGLLWSFPVADLLTFVHRAERIVKEYGEREETPEQRLRDKDKRRAAYHRFYTDMKWGQAQNYHITLDSGKMGIDKCVEIIVNLF